jgi:hypothetical protein
MIQVPMLPQDKASHFFYGAIIAFVVLALFGPLWAMGAVVIVSVLKEVYDKFSKTGTMSLFDALFTIAGGLVVVLPTYPILR